ncbi:hypothetical protein [Parendozoicomonas haliclonae]|uniref:hypothetical protein n=1 Tax=Parendozoicomonas haliclonae TaxID=1960125 RepID=UPI001055D2A4|nr:hypothetical protein [Parendozoicomonas haliclonae]
MNKRRLAIVSVWVLLLPSLVWGQEPESQKLETSWHDYTPALYTAGRYALGAGALIGLAAMQSVVESKLRGYGSLAKMGHYIFYPLTMSVSLVTLTPFQSWLGHYIHGVLAPAENKDEEKGDDYTLEGLWFRTYQAYSMNAQMSRNVVMALNTMSFLYLERVMLHLSAGRYEAAVDTQAHFFRMAKKYYAEIGFTSPVWDEVFIPHARPIWKPYRDSDLCRDLDEQLIPEARTLMLEKTLQCGEFE